MSDAVLRVDQVSKKFRKGQLHDSLRDLIPALIRNALRPRRPGGELGDREFWALRDVTFETQRGEALGIIGRNGAGKSTMLKLLAGIMKPTSGVIHVGGRLSALIELGAGFHPDLTGRENVYLNGSILGMKREDIRRNFDAIVDFSGLTEFIDTPVKRYSSGMFARLGFAVAAHLEPEILVVDEVLSVGDYLFQRKSLDKMRDIARGGASVIFVSHNLPAVTELCSRCVLLEAGRVHAAGPTGEVVRDYINAFSIAAAQASETMPAYVSRFVMRGAAGENVRFSSGETVRFDVEVTARQHVESFAVSIGMADERQYVVFSTSTERLGAPAYTMDPGDRISVTFEMDLHLAPGAYYLGIALHRYNVQKDYGQFAVGTLFIHADVDVRGVVNLVPRLVPAGAPFA
ncbi:MAG TPA: ABC transporter ATP-binding protein [Gemmatimonadaceae bacterium]|nr:ABC transporter ATP-binding protein [Gemmatimonadaceae bacterium]